MTTAPEAILARFADEYAEHKSGPERRLRVTFHWDFQWYDIDGYVVVVDGEFWLQRSPRERPWCRMVPLNEITRIDYSNARYRGDQPLWEREG